MAAARTDLETCSVCGRGILKGERTYEYATPAGEIRGVCALCRPSAERAGWIPPGRLGSVTEPSQEHRHPRLGVRFARLSEELRRRTETRRHAAAEARGRSAAEARDRSAAPPATPERDAAPGPALPADPIARALAAFNSGQTPRMIAGLTRSLGEPRAEVKRDGDRVVVTVAWELSWYSWEISGYDVRQIAKGAEISEREQPEPEWNARAEADGTLTLVGAP